ncbi:UvrD-helicase domain-containing protein [Pseudoscardovia radai]|uniref:UvrD-helicase domain-containing protein n=1 Tax=Pseudoscardovia radai TaxID=987066 RepID=UPI003993DC84
MKNTQKDMAATSNTVKKPTAEQSRVIDAPADKDLIVVAGAGSGKTFTMTERIVKLITRDGVPAEKILGLTFTRKAATELLGRVSSRVGQALAESGNDPDAAFMKPEVSTYDAFFQSIVRRYGLLVGMDPRTLPLSDAGAMQLITDVVGDNLDTLFATGALDSDTAATADQNQSEGDSEDSNDSEGPGGLNKLVQDVYALSENIANSMISDECLTVDDAVTAIQEWDARFLARLEILKKDPGLSDIDFDNLPKQKPTAPLKSTQGRKIPNMTFEEWYQGGGFQRNKATVHRYDAWIIKKMEETVRRRDLLLPLVRSYAAAKKEANLAEFSDFTIAAYQLVVRFPSIGAEYRRRYSNVFLDEYQDTSTTQAMLLARLFHADSQHRSAVTAVGDPYQSIYAWRGASPGAFRLFMTNFGITEKPYELTISRRNPKVVLEAANKLTDAFHTRYRVESNVPESMREVPVSRLRPLEDVTGNNVVSQNAGDDVAEGDDMSHPLGPTVRMLGGAIESDMLDELGVPGGILPFGDQPPTGDEDEEGAPQIIDPYESVDVVAGNLARLRENEMPAKDDGDKPGPDDSSLLAMMECDTIDEEVAAVVAFANHVIPKYRNAEGVPLAVLFRTKKQMPRYRAALEEAGFTCQVVGIDPLTERPDVRDILHLLSACADHTDAVSLQELLVSPRMNIGMDDMRALAELAESVNADRQYRALADAGIIEADSDATQADRRKAVARARATVQPPTLAYLNDIVMSEDLSTLLDNSTISDHGKLLVRDLARMMHAVEHATRSGLQHAIRTAGTVLGLQVDEDVAACLTHDGASSESTYAPALDMLLAQADAYANELPAGRTPGIVGFCAWIDEMRHIPEGPADVIDGSADVLLMTIHQSKGLEWPAVAVVDMSSKVFPSAKGEGLAITLPVDTEESALDPVQTYGGDANPEYISVCTTWLERPIAVPTPVRADRDILPAFPHRGEVEDIASVAQLEHEFDDAIFRRNREDHAPGDVYLSQAEEYGRRLHDDERRLGYVALTRAEHEVLLTCTDSNKSLDGRFTKKKDDREWAKQLLLWFLDAVEYLGGFDSESEPGANHGLQLLPQRATPERLAGWLKAGQSDPIIFAARETDALVPWVVAMQLSYLQKYGEDKGYRNYPSIDYYPVADPFAEHKDRTGPSVLWLEVFSYLLDSGHVHEQATSTPVNRRLSRYALPVAASMLGLRAPTGLVVGSDADECRALNRDLVEWSSWKACDMLAGEMQQLFSIVRSKGKSVGRDGYWPGQLGERERAILGLSAQMAQSDFGAESDALGGADGEDDSSLLSQARQVVAEDKARQAAGSDIFARANAVRHDRIASVTSLEATTAVRNNATQAESMALSILRPVPQEPDRSASRGTRFHSWAQAFLNARIQGEVDDRETMIAGIETDATTMGFEKAWRHRLASSSWARRMPIGAEQKITASVGDVLITGTIDAIFEGGLDPDDPTALTGDDGRVTIVDWKTGKRPDTEEERALRLIQLDVYRLLYARISGIPLDHIDATLYYVGVKDEAGRFVVARRKTEEEIVDEIEKGLYLSKDTDSQDADTKEADSQ